MDVEVGDFQDWEVVLQNSDSNPVEDIKDLEGIEGESEGIIRSDYFSLDSQSKYPRTDVIEEGSVESDNPSWIDPGSVMETQSPMKELREYWSDSGSDRSDDRKMGEFEGKNGKGEVGSDGIIAESGNSGKFWSDSRGNDGFEEKIEMGVGDNSNSGDGLGVFDEKDETDGLMEGDKESENGNVVVGEMKSIGEGEKRIMVWWKLPFELLKYYVLRMSPVWTVSIAAAVMSFVILGRRYYRTKNKSRSLQLKVTMDDKKVSQFMSRAARLNEAFSIVKRVPVIRPSLPAVGVTPWPMMSLR